MINSSEKKYKIAMVKFSLSLCKRPLIEIFFSVIEMAQTDEHASTL
jgi:hypothetical protein